MDSKHFCFGVFIKKWTTDFDQRFHLLVDGTVCFFTTRELTLMLTHEFTKPIYTLSL